MDNKKFEQLIDLIINENEEQARALFHDIVVEKSREIYESMMDDEEMDESMGGQVGDMLDEISAEESGMTEEDEDFADIEDHDGDEIVDIDQGDMGDGSDEELEDRVVDLEDKLDQLMAEFEELMGHEEGEEHEEGHDEEDFGDEEDLGDEEGEEDFGDDDEQDMMESSDDDEEDDEEDEEDVSESLEEAVQLKNVPGLYGSKIGGDNGAQPKSPIGKTANSGQSGMASKPVKFSGDTESVPTSPKAPSNYGTKGETQVKHAGQFKNVPGSDAGKSSFKEKASRDWGKKDSSTGKEVGAGGTVAQNDKSPVAESRKSLKKRVK